jgi:hypothetical protein
MEIKAAMQATVRLSVNENLPILPKPTTDVGRIRLMGGANPNTLAA